MLAGLLSKLVGTVPTCASSDSLAWYWWLIIAIAIALVIGGIIAAIVNKRKKEADYTKLELTTGNANPYVTPSTKWKILKDDNRKLITSKC